MRNITSKVFVCIAIFAELAFASSGASANFVYEYGQMFETELHGEKADFDAKVLFQNPLAFDWDSTNINNDGGKAFLFSLAIPFNINSFTFKPSFLFASGKWQKGDFEYFYGKPDLPEVFGLSAYVCHYSNLVGVNYIFGNAKILNNSESEELFNSDFYIYNAFYRFGAIRNLNLYAGFAGLNAETSGALTAENQQYFLFPYSFYNASGHINAKAVYGIANLVFESGAAEYGIDLGALFAVSGKITGNMHYKYRKFYGKDENIETLNPVQIKNNGIIFSVLNIKTKRINIGENNIQYGIKKPLAIPFGKIFPTNRSDNNGKILKDALLWGLTASVDVEF